MQPGQELSTLLQLCTKVYVHAEFRQRTIYTIWCQEQAHYTFRYRLFYTPPSFSVHFCFHDVGVWGGSNLHCSWLGKVQLAYTAEDTGNYKMRW